MPERTRRAPRGSVVVNDILLRLARPMHMELINVYGRKVNQGDPGPDDHPVNSTWIQSSWAGGGQIENANPASHTDRFWWAEAETERPRSLTLPVLTDSFSPPAGNDFNPIVMGEFPPGPTSRVYVAWGTDLQILDEGVGFSAFDTLSLPPVRNWVVYTTHAAGALGAKGTRVAFIPQGTGYEVIDVSGVVYTGTEDAIDFAVWDNKLFRLSGSGVIDWTLDGTTWQAVPPITGVPDGSVPRRLLSFLDDRGEPTLYLITDGSYFLLDFNFSTLRQTDTFFPRHPFHGIAANVWRAQLYTGVGVGVQQYQPGVLAAVGLDRNDGLPQEYQGYITDFAPEYNNLYALLAGIPIVSGAVETAGLFLGGGDDQLYVGLNSTNALLMKWNGQGWHYVWSFPNATPTNVETTNCQGVYRLWWGAGGRVYTQKLPYGYFNPSAAIGVDYAEEGYYETAWHNWGWDGTPKIAKKIELETLGCSETETVYIEYKLDNDTNDWAFVGLVTTNGEHAFFLNGDETLGESYGLPVLYKGAVHEKIKLRFTFARGSNPQAHPVVKWHSVVARKFLLPQRSWRLVIDNTKEYANNPTSVITRILQSIAINQGAITFVSDESDEVYMVDLVSYTLEGPGEGGLGMTTINLLESNEAEPIDG